jgi:hypothetical protein
VNKYFYIHTLEGRFFRRFSLAFMEGALVNAPLELRFLNPMMVFHNLYAWTDYDEYPGEEPDLDEPEDKRVAPFFALRVELEPFRHWRIYGIWAMNELHTPGERIDEPRALRPDSLAFQAGVEFAAPLPGALLSFGLEGVYTYPFVYISRDKRWSFYKPRNGNSGPYEYWTGSPFGPDSLAADCWASWDAGRWSLSGNFLFLAQGERSKFSVFDTPEYHPVLLDDYEATLLKSPSGTPSYTWQLEFEGTWYPKSWLALSFSPGWRLTLNHGNIPDRVEQGFEFALSLRFIPRELRQFDLGWR